MGSPHPSRHAAFFYASEDASLAHVLEFLVAGARDGERLMVIMVRARWDAVKAKLVREATHALAAQLDALIVADATAILDATVRNGTFERARFDATLPVLLANGQAPKRVYSEAASMLVGRHNLAAAVALEHAEQQIADGTGLQICCGFDLQHFPEDEHDWQVRAMINAHEDAVVGSDAWTRPVPPDAERRVAKRAELILLWDDYRDTRIMYAEALTFSGYRVITAASGGQALALAKAYRPDLLVLDVRLPAKVAVAGMRRLRADPEFNAPILALTAHAFRDERADIFSRGFDMVLSKPCLPDALVAAVAEALSRPPRD